MNKLESKLAETAKLRESEHASLIDEVKLLLDSNASEEINTLRSIGLDSDINYIQSKQEDLLIRKTHGAHLEKQIVHLDEIKALCVKYRLFMHKANQYIGTIPPELGAELARFCKEKNIAVPANSSHSMFFIIAPPKMFRQYRTFGQILEKEWTEVSDIRAERQRLKDLDPILVYKLNNSNHFAIVKSWGENFTPLRRLYSYLTRPLTTRATSISFNLAVLAAIFMCGKWFLLKMNSMDIINESHHVKSAWTILGVMLPAAIFGASLIWWFCDDDMMRFRRKVRQAMTDKEHIFLS